MPRRQPRRKPSRKPSRKPCRKPCRQPSRLSFAAAALCALVACRREQAGQTAVLLTLTTRGPVQCVVITEQPYPGLPVPDGGISLGGNVLTQTLSLGAGLPDGFGTNDGWRTASVTALIYGGGGLGNDKISISAEGHRGSCAGPVVAAVAPVAVQLAQGQVVRQDSILALLGEDKDGDGWPVPDDCNDNDPTIYPGAPELCDGKDHACTGVLDRGCPCQGGAGGQRDCYPLGLDSGTLGVGICKAGVQTCVDGKWGAECAGAVTPLPESCNGKDNNCDGTVGLPSCPCTAGETQRCYTKGPLALAGVGRCSWGKRVCGADGSYGSCEGDQAPLPYELCNGIDDNCDGQIDEEVDQNNKAVMVRPLCANQEGVCSGAKKSCVGAAFQACGIAEYQQSATAHGTFYGPNSCGDAIDHACSGSVPANCPCSKVGVSRDCYSAGLQSPTLAHGPCHKGTQSCIRDGSGNLTWSECANQLLPKKEICNGVDDDCNGLTDDFVAGEGQPCPTGQPGVCAAGYKHCAAADFQCAPLIAPSPEICDGLDNNCNGQIDELWNKQTDPRHCGTTYSCVACPSGDACCAGHCSDFQSDPNNCGACGAVCGAGQGCCAGQCQQLDTQVSCGACGKACGTGQVCRQAQCVPDHETVCNNGIDDNLNGLTDCQDPDCDRKLCDQSGGSCYQGKCQHETVCDDGIDNDGDGKTDCQDDDCFGKRCQQHGVCTADHRCVVELCHNGLDDNGDGLTDCQDPLACPAPSALANPRCCGVAWVDAKLDVANCGACGNDCRTGHSAECGTVACVSGACKYGPAPNRTTCSAGVCCGGNCVPDRETSCGDRIDNNCDGKIDCQDPLSCPPPPGLTSATCCNLSWTDTDHGDPLNCGQCGRSCPQPPDACSAAVCNAGGQCGTAVDCTKPGCDGTGCVTPGGAQGQCAGGVCCSGCLDPDGTCHAGTDLHQCVSGSFACEDCQPSNNQCVSDACTATGCTHTNNTNSCTDAGGTPGVCHDGGCCTGCFDSSGACQPISPAHCGLAGKACLAQSCVDGNPCSQDVCDTTGSVAVCRNPPVSDGGSCQSNSAPGKCEGGQCCVGCVTGGGLCLTPASESTTACGSAGNACVACPVPPSTCQDAACAFGSCGVKNKPDATVCTGSGGQQGNCSNGVCILCAVACNGVCCGPGDRCKNSQCTCDPNTCAGACSAATPSVCQPPSPSVCSNAGKIFCPLTPSCVLSCANSCGVDSVRCGGATCLQPGVASTDNVCSDGTHPESCDLLTGSTIAVCSCDGNASPGTCPGPGNKTVCETTGADFHCGQCGDNFTDGDTCKNGKTCHQANGFGGACF